MIPDEIREQVFRKWLAQERDGVTQETTIRNLDLDMVVVRGIWMAGYKCCDWSHKIIGEVRCDHGR